jgi:hypothetical protein
VHCKGQENIFGIEPLGSPIFHRVNQGVVKILLFFLESKLDPDDTQDAGASSAGVWFPLEEIVKESDGRWNTKEGFTKMNDGREMKDGVGIQMVQFYVIIVQTESVFNKRDK